MSIQKIRQESLDFGLTGAIAFFGLNTAPAGWLKANGALVSRTTYASLFAVIGTTYGAGDGSTTFALPDMRGEFPRGWDDGRGADSGRTFGSAQLDQLQNITGRLFSQGSGATSAGFNSADGAFVLSEQVDAGYQTAAGFTRSGRATFNLSSDSNGRVGTETRGRNVALLACIKF
jgi:microcystin-dependent protein